MARRGRGKKLAIGLVIARIIPSGFCSLGVNLALTAHSTLCRYRMSDLRETTQRPFDLYKYTSVRNAVRILTSLKVRFTPATELNDPFEMAPYFDEPITSHSLRNAALKNPAEFNQNFRTALETEYDKHVGDLRTMFTKDQFVSVSTKLMSHPAFARLLVDGTNGLMRLLGSTMNAGFQDGLSKSLGILCLSSKPLNELMWAHYADSHKGVALVFSADHDFILQANHKAANIRAARPVVYTDARPTFHDLLSIPNTKEADALLLEMMFFTKSSVWSYEGEYRALRPLSEASAVEEINSQQLHLFDVPPSCLQGVMFGANCKPDDAAAIYDIVEDINTSHQVNIRCCRVLPSESKFELNLSLYR